MISRGQYHGDKADIWSIGCIVLELVLGHNNFNTIWMPSYKIEIIRAKTGFEEGVENALDKIGDILVEKETSNHDLHNFIFSMLQLTPDDRSSARKLSAAAFCRDCSQRPQSAGPASLSTLGMVASTIAAVARRSHDILPSINPDSDGSSANQNGSSFLPFFRR